MLSHWIKVFRGSEQGERNRGGERYRAKENERERENRLFSLRDTPTKH